MPSKPLNEHPKNTLRATPTEIELPFDCSEDLLAELEKGLEDSARLLEELEKGSKASESDLAELEKLTRETLY